MSGRQLGWLPRLASHLITADHREDVIDDLVDERNRRGWSSLWLAWQFVRSASDSRRVARLAARERHSEGNHMRNRLPIPTLHDLRLAGRTIWRARASTAAILLTLALAIGGTASMFSVVHAVLMEPLPYADPDRVVRVWERHLPRNRERNVVAPANFMEWRDRAGTLTDFAGISYGSASITGDGRPERVPSAVVTWNLFPSLGVTPAIGRMFVEGDGVDTAQPVTLLSWQLWQRRYGGDEALVGRTIQINARPVRVIGIMPAGFRLFGEDREVWSPFPVGEGWRETHGRGIHVVARLAPGATLAEANAEMDVIAGALEEQWPEANAGWRVSVVDARADLVGDLGQPLALLLVAVALVLLVGCANAANLLLARAAERRREFEVRTALGATRSRIVSQLLLEGLVLGALGTIAGLAVAHVALGAIANVAGTAFGVPRLENAELNLPVFAVALALLTLCTLAFGLVPGWLAGRATGNPMLTGATRVWTGGPVERRIRAGLVVAQVAFAVLLVVSAALVGRSLSRLVSVDPGFDPGNVLTFTVSLPNATYPSDEQQVAFFERAAESLRALPGVDDVGAISWIPFGGPGGGTSYDVDGRVPLAAADRPVADIRPVDAAYFDVMRIPIRQGRAFTPDEVRSGARVTVVNETLVRLMFPTENPIGKRLQVNWNDGLDEIVGVVGDVKISSLDADVRSQIYFPQGAANVGFVTYVMRTTVDDEMSLSRIAESTIQSFDANLPVRDVRPMQARLDESVAASRVSTWLVGAFGGLALLLALIGVAGLQAASVAARLPEFGIRLALGATPGRIRRLVLGQAGWLIGVGLALGLAAAVAASRLLTGLLFDVPATDPLTFAGVATSIAALGLIACVLSTRRATRVDPADTLRG